MEEYRYFGQPSGPVLRRIHATLDSSLQDNIRFLTRQRQRRVDRLERIVNKFAKRSSWLLWWQLMREWRLLQWGLKMMATGLARRGWRTWQDGYLEARRQARLLAGAVRRMLQRKLSQAWESWQDWYAQLQQQKVEHRPVLPVDLVLGSG